MEEEFVQTKTLETSQVDQKTSKSLGLKNKLVNGGKRFVSKVRSICFGNKKRTAGSVIAIITTICIIIALFDSNEQPGSG